MTAITIQQVLRPILITCFVLGLGVYPLKAPNSNIRWIAYLSILYSLIVWLVYAYLLYYTVNFFTWKLLYNSTVRFIVTEISIFTAIVSIIMSFYHQKRFVLCMKKLAVVDDTLKELATPKIYRKTHIRSKGIVIGWIVCSLALNFSDTIYWLNIKETASWGLFLPHILNHCLHINAFIDLLFIFFLWNIGTRFEEINELMQCLLVKKEHDLRCTWKKSLIPHRSYTLNTNNYKLTLWTSMHLHFELCRIARELNMIFGTQMTSEMASYFVFVTTACYGLYTLMIQNFQYEISVYVWYNKILWPFIFLARLYMVNYMCTSVRLKANKIDKIIHELTCILRYTNIWKEICQFTLQTKHHPLRFTGMGLFYFGNSFLRKFYMTILMYVIIMVQMKTPINNYVSDTAFIKKRITKLTSYQF